MSRKPQTANAKPITVTLATLNKPIPEIYQDSQTDYYFNLRYDSDLFTAAVDGRNDSSSNNSNKKQK